VSGKTLCTLDELKARRSLGFEIDGTDVFLVLDGDRVCGYLDRCPHRGTPLAWKPDDYLDRDGQHLICATHGALFDIGSGHCIAGPCAGAGLTPIEVAVVAGKVVARLPATE